MRLLLQHGADADAKDFASGKTALKMAEQHGHQDVIEALDPAAAAAAAARRARGSGYSYGPPSDEEEARYVPPPPLVPGQVVVLDHRIRLDTTLSAFNWEDYEQALGRLASCAAPTDCFVSPEPGESFVTAHATLVVRTGPSDRMATISTAIRALQQKSALKRAAGGATLLGGPRVTLLGEVVELAQPTP